MPQRGGLWRRAGAGHGPPHGSVETLLWFFTYHLTLVPVGILAPIFLLLGCLIPLGVYRSATRASLVERLRATED